MSTAQHTPTPFKLHGRDTIVALKNGRQVHIAATLVDMPVDRHMLETQKVRQEEQAANAAFFVHACNSHEALLEVAKLVVAIGDCMMLSHVHDDFAVKEILAKHGYATVELMAKAAEDLARFTIAKVEKEAL